MRLLVLSVFSASVLATVLVSCYNPDTKNKGFTCDPADDPPCPAGFECRNRFCEAVSATTGAISIDKTEYYTGEQYTNASLGMADTCPDKDYEPGDGPTKAPLKMSPRLDAPPEKTPKMAICPTGIAPWSNAHDVDYFKVDASTDAGANTITLKAEITYDVKYGDLDIAIVDSSGTTVKDDGTAKSNGCVAATVTPGVYYVVIVGAKNPNKPEADVNTYELKVQTSTLPKNCDTVVQPPADMADGT
jgi:hypothetical protein